MVNKTTPKDAFADILVRLTDRFLPDTSKRANLSTRKKYTAISLGVLTWVLFTVISIAFRFPNLFSPTDYESTILAQNLPLLFGVFLLLFLLLVILFTVLIGTSVKKGAALNFYLWGITVPALVFGILNFSPISLKFHQIFHRFLKFH